MRRGLISWSKAELPEHVFESRIARTRAMMTAEKLDALMIYTNHTRPSAVSWLTGFIPYWSQGVTVLGPEGKPSLVVSLSKRGETWIRATARVDGVVCTPRPGAEAARIVAQRKANAVVGVPDLETLPSGIAEEFAAAQPGLKLVDATKVVRALRVRSDAAEIALAARAATIARDALNQVTKEHTDASGPIAAAEVEARRAGAEEVFIAVAPDLHRNPHLHRIEGNIALGSAFAFRATVAYKGVWVRMVRTLLREEHRASALTEALARLADAAAELPGTHGFSGAAQWLVEGCRLAAPLEPLMGSAIPHPLPPAPGALVSVQMTLKIDGIPIIVGAPALTGGGVEGAGSLLLPPVFEDDAGSGLEWER